MLKRMFHAMSWALPWLALTGIVISTTGFVLQWTSQSLALAHMTCSASDCYIVGHSLVFISAILYCLLPERHWQ